jgi:hypothetical protein
MENNKVYLLPNMCIQSFCNTDTMHRECRMLRFKIMVFRVMGSCCRTGGYRGVGEDRLPPTYVCL